MVRLFTLNAVKEMIPVLTLYMLASFTAATFEPGQ